MLTHDLSLLETRGLVRVTTDEAKPVVRFKHALTREATYNSILQSRRTELHCVVAKVLAEAHQQLDLELVLSIAEHQLFCRDGASMVEFLLPFAARLIYSGRSTSLTQLLTQVDRSALTETQRRDVDMALADAHAARGEYAAARTLYENVLGSALSDMQRAQLLYSLGAAAYHLHDNARAIEYQRESLQLARALGDVKLQIRASSGLGLAYWNLGDYENAQKNLVLARSMGLETGDSIELALAEYNFAGMLLDLADFHTALEHAVAAANGFQKHGHLPLAVRAMQMIGACHYGLKHLAEAAHIYRQTIEKSKELDDSIVTALGFGNLAEVYADWNELPLAANAYTEAIQHLQTRKYDSLLAYYLACLASAQIRQAQNTFADNANELLDTAEGNVKNALTLATQIQSQEDEAVALRVFAELGAAHGEWENALEYARQAVLLLEPLGRALELARAQKTEQEILAAAQRS